MIRRVVFWLLLLSQLSIGALGAHAAELAVSSALTMLQTPVGDPSGLQFRQVVDVDDAASARTRIRELVTPPSETSVESTSIVIRDASLADAPHGIAPAVIMANKRKLNAMSASGYDPGGV